jgi:hypothetical protein
MKKHLETSSPINLMVVSPSNTSLYISWRSVVYIHCSDARINRFPRNFTLYFSEFYPIYYEFLNLERISGNK